jgi:hypothetical protein
MKGSNLGEGQTIFPSLSSMSASVEEAVQAADKQMTALGPKLLIRDVRYHGS